MPFIYNNKIAHKNNLTHVPIYIYVSKYHVRISTSVIIRFDILIYGLALGGRKILGIKLRNRNVESINKPSKYIVIIIFIYYNNKSKHNLAQPNIY